MEPKLITKEEKKVIGIVLHTSFTNERNKQEIPPFFHKVLEEKKLEKVLNRINENQLCVFKRTRNCPDFDYVMGVKVSNTDNIPKGMESVILPKSNYASLTIVKRGPEDVGKAFGHIYEKWIPKSIYIPTGAPGFIYYDNRFFSVFNKEGYKGNPIATVNVPIKPFFIKRILKLFSLVYS
ncbi:MAG: effector binding domain-containing protein [Bacteroidetes bacterium]|nr:effector binding domain-containing protein [Bacteroidota bacterium]